MLVFLFCEALLFWKDVDVKSERLPFDILEWIPNYSSSSLSFWPRTMLMAFEFVVYISCSFYLFPERQLSEFYWPIQNMYVL